MWNFLRNSLSACLLLRNLSPYAKTFVWSRCFKYLLPLRSQITYQRRQEELGITGKLRNESPQQLVHEGFQRRQVTQYSISWKSSDRSHVCSIFMAFPCTELSWWFTTKSLWHFNGLRIYITNILEMLIVHFGVTILVYLFLLRRCIQNWICLVFCLHF